MDKQRKKKRDSDFSVIALRVVHEATGQTESDKGRFKSVAEGKNARASELGRRGGLKGGKSRARKLTPEQRKDIARKAAQTRWNKK